MSKDKGGASPQVREIGDAPNITRLLELKDYSGMNVYSSWSSPEVFARYLEQVDPSTAWYGDNVWKDANRRFSGCASVAEAIDLCRNGWKEGGETIEKTRGYIRALNPLVNKPIKYAIAGSTPNVPRAIAGNILNMRAPDVDKSSKRKVITIIYNMCENGGVDKDNIVNKAAVMAALIDEIESKGFSCEVIATAYTGNHRCNALTSVCVKPSHQPVDINRMAFSLGHSAMFRILFFADWQINKDCEGLGYGLGCAKSTQPSKEENERDIYTIRSSNGCMKHFKDMESSATKGLNYLVNELRDQGCPAFPKMTEKEHKDVLEQNEAEDRFRFRHDPDDYYGDDEDDD